MSRVDPWEWFIANENLVSHCVRKVMRRSDYETHVSFDDLKSHCQDKLPGIIERDNGESKLSHWVYYNLYLIMGNYIQKRNKIMRKQLSLQESTVSVVLIDPLRSVEDQLLSQQLIEILRANLSPYEVDLLVRHHCLEENFETIGERWKLSRATVQRNYLSTLFKARKMMKGCWT